MSGKAQIVRIGIVFSYHLYNRVEYPIVLNLFRAHEALGLCDVMRSIK